MARSQLKTWLESDAARLVWIEYADYARNVFAHGAEDWYRDSNKFASTLAEAHSVLPSSVLSVELLAPGSGAVFAQAQQLAPLAAAMAVITSAQGCQFIDDALDALIHRFSERVDIVLSIPANATLLRACGLQDEPSFDDLDDIGVALTELLRTHAERPVAGLLIRHDDGAALADDERDALEPVVSAARHYGWVVVHELPGDADLLNDTFPGADVVVLPDCESASLESKRAGVAVGGGLVAEGWRSGMFANLSSHGLLYGRVPADAAPERVVAAARDLC